MESYVNPEYPEIGPCRIRIMSDMPWQGGWRIESWASVNRARVTRGNYIHELDPSNIEVLDV